MKITVSCSPSFKNTIEYLESSWVNVDFELADKPPEVHKKRKSPRLEKPEVSLEPKMEAMFGPTVESKWVFTKSLSPKYTADSLATLKQTDLSTEQHTDR